MTERAALQALARLWGIQAAYRSSDGRRRAASDDALVAVLQALGAPLRGPRDAAACLAERRAALEHRALEPVLVAWDGRLPALRPLVARAGRRLRCQLLREDGAVHAWDLASDGAPRARLPLGVHRLVLDDVRAPSWIISAPRRAWSNADEDGGWGVFAPLYGLRSRASLGVGDLGDLRRLGVWTRERGGRFVGTLPLLAAFLDEPFEPSPYAPVSRTFWNELYLEVSAIPELADAPAARRLLGSATARQSLARLRRARLVDLREAMRLKRRLLEALAATARRPARQAALEEFLAANPRARDYARFRTAVEMRGTPWPQWSGAARAGRLAPRDLDPARVAYHCYVQWLVDEQIRAVGTGTSPHPTGLYLDLPLGVHGGGYDTWRERPAFAHGVEVGAPPDAFFAGGQRWGVPPLHPERIRDDGYAHPRAYLRHHMRVASVLRLDHVMGLHRLYWVPRGFDATQGVYVRHRPEEWYALVSLESHRERCTVVGENLGTVPAAVHAAMARRGLLRMHVLQFEIDPARPVSLRAAPADALASLGTHDTPPFAGWWAGRDLDDGEARGLLAPAAAARERRQRAALRRALVRGLRRAGHLGRATPTVAAVRDGCLRFLAAGRARLLLVSLEDLWLEELPQNVPGTADRANWCRRLRVGLERLVADPTVRVTLADVDAHRRLRDPRGHGK